MRRYSRLAFGAAMAATANALTGAYAETLVSPPTPVAQTASTPAFEDSTTAAGDKLRVWPKKAVMTVVVQSPKDGGESVVMTTGCAGAIPVLMYGERSAGEQEKVKKVMPPSYIIDAALDTARGLCVGHLPNRYLLEQVMERAYIDFKKAGSGAPKQPLPPPTNADGSLRVLINPLVTAHP
jgi:hypothetical protein